MGFSWLCGIIIIIFRENNVRLDSCMWGVCTIRRTLLRLSGQGAWGRLGMWHAWKTRVMHTFQSKKTVGKRIAMQRKCRWRITLKYVANMTWRCGLHFCLSRQWPAALFCTRRKNVCSSHGTGNVLTRWKTLSLVGTTLLSDVNLMLFLFT